VLLVSSGYMVLGLFLLAILAVAWPGGRRVLSLVVLIGATASMLGAQVAVMTGDWLEEQVRDTSVVHDHAELGEGTRTLAILMFLAAVGFVAREWRDRLPGGERLRPLLAPRGVAVALSVVLLATAVLTTVWVVRTGHMGAKATWSEVSVVAASLKKKATRRKSLSRRLIPRSAQLVVAGPPVPGPARGLVGAGHHLRQLQHPRRLVAREQLMGLHDGDAAAGRDGRRHGGGVLGAGRLEDRQAVVLAEHPVEGDEVTSGGLDHLAGRLGAVLGTLDHRPPRLPRVREERQIRAHPGLHPGLGRTRAPRAEPRGARLSTP
jgi:hypothetical protein